jgi:hypothetical protein
MGSCSCSLLQGRQLACGCSQLEAQLLVGVLQLCQVCQQGGVVPHEAPAVGLLVSKGLQGTQWGRIQGWTHGMKCGSIRKRVCKVMQLLL